MLLSAKDKIIDGVLKRNLDQDFREFFIKACNTNWYPIVIGNRFSPDKFIKISIEVEDILFFVIKDTIEQREFSTSSYYYLRENVLVGSEQAFINHLTIFLTTPIQKLPLYCKD